MLLRPVGLLILIALSTVLLECTLVAFQIDCIIFANRDANRADRDASDDELW